MAPEFRVINTGLRSGRDNIAFDKALIDSRLADDIPDTIRFLRFPPTALVGLHQDLRREIKLEYCRKKSIGIARRITGGGAIYFDEGQLGWELVFKALEAQLQLLKMQLPLITRKNQTLT